VGESKEIVKLRAHSGAPEGNRNAAKVKVENGNNPDVIRIVYGTSTQYLIARLERDHPAIHERLKRGEYKSVRAAAKEGQLGVNYRLVLCY
jgi:hypothetical protein